MIGRGSGAGFIEINCLDLDAKTADMMRSTRLVFSYLFKVEYSLLLR